MKEWYKWINFSTKKSKCVHAQKHTPQKVNSEEKDWI